MLNGTSGVPKKGKLVEGTNCPILRLMIIEADIRALPYHGQWSGIEVDVDDRIIVWSESDMTAAFCCFLLEPSWYPFQAINKTVPGSFATEFDSALANEPGVYPALRVMPVGWHSACDLLQYFHRRLCFLPPPLGAGLDTRKLKQLFFFFNLEGLIFLCSYSFKFFRIIYFCSYIFFLPELILHKYSVEG